MINVPILLFGIHCHQPVGNFEGVVEYAFKRSYLPFLRVASGYEVPFAVHFSGPLLEWMENREHQTLELLGGMVERGQLEVLVSGMYEPVLPSIPSWDRLGQMEMAKEWVVRLFGVEPKGVWLTERVWEQQIVTELVKAGMEYVVVDDHHLLCAGVERERIHGYFLTEHEGSTLAVFPIKKALRYLVPFKKIELVKKGLMGLEPCTAHTLFDDGEKFGLWPGTHGWVYGRGWLERFFDFLENGSVSPMGFGDYLASSRPSGRVYLPSVSYPEMGEWALPPKAALRLDALKKGLNDENASLFLRGGTWKNFLVRYPESNWLHKRGLWVSKAVNRLHPSPLKDDARRHLYRAQCNDAYWHGVFGGLYAPHLRRALWRELLAAQGLCSHDAPAIHTRDLDCDGETEVFLQDEGLFAAFKPSQGGCMVELSSLDWEECLTNVLTRRPERYHLEAAKGSGEESDGVNSIHHSPVGRSGKVVYDPYQKCSFLDHLLSRPSKRALESGELNEPLKPWSVPYQYQVLSRSLRMSLSCSLGDGELWIAKEFSLTQDGLLACYEVMADASDSFHFAVELNIIFPSERFGEILAFSTEKARHVAVTKGGVVKGCGGLVLRDPLWKGQVRIALKENVDLIVVPNTTVSRSESGLERVYQGNTFLLCRHLDAGREEFSVSIALEEKGDSSV